MGIPLPNPFWAVYFPMGNAATGFMVIFALIAGVVGAGSCLSGLHHIMLWTDHSLHSAASAAMTAWALTLLAMGLGRIYVLKGECVSVDRLVDWWELILSTWVHYFEYWAY